ncbi:putative glycerate kinase [Apostichopus japonicus]|uniref:Glycerate kinase n=1 Tax=Stichopus japonicus TaxID=307972 RepID=A0A2G8JDN1_STIJA|nr:putative glycerate kinase [Apostichopus japonicus]
MSASVDYSIDHSITEKQASDAKMIFQAGVEAVLPGKMVKEALTVKGDKLFVGDQVYKLKRNVHIAAFGKAVVGMVSAAEHCLGDHIVSGVASTPVGLKEALQNAGKSHLWPSEFSKVEIIEGARNNIPDESSMLAAQKIKQLAMNLCEEDILLVLISGGGSALLPSLTPPITLQHKQNITNLLASRGASIQELNTVRSAVSSLKGGKLALLARPAKIISLILSDIVGDPIELIASGPTAPSQATSHECLQILDKYTLPGEIHDVIRAVISQTQPNNSTFHVDFDHVNNIIVGNNRKAVAASMKASEQMGYSPFLLSDSICGEAREIGELYAELAELLSKIMRAPESSSCEQIRLPDLLNSFQISEDTCESLLELAIRNNPVCIIGAGETTVTLQGKGMGGRNQEMALAWAIAIQTLETKGFEVTFLCGGTDGQDGPTDAAGAWVFPGLVSNASTYNVSALEALKHNDSYTFFTEYMNGNNLLKMGLTGTNVMDIQVLLIKPLVLRDYKVN